MLNFLKKLVSPIVDIIKKAIKNVVLLWEKVKKIFPSFKNIWEGVKNIWEWIKSIGDRIRDMIGNVFKKFKSIGESIIGGAKKMVEDAAKKSDAMCAWTKGKYLLNKLCYYPTFAVMLVWGKVQDLVVLAVDLMFTLINKLGGGKISTGTHEGAKTACHVARFMFITNPFANLAIFAGCVAAQRFLAMLVDVLDWLLRVLTDLSITLYKELGSPDYFDKGGIDFRTKASAAVLCKWWKENTTRWILHGIFMFSCHFFARMSWGAMSVINQVWFVFQTAVVKEALGIHNMGLDHKLFRPTDGCNWLASVEMGPLNSMVSIACDVVNPLLIDGVIFVGWVLTTIEETMNGVGRFYELVRDFAALLMNASKKAVADLFNSAKEGTEVVGLGDQATTKVVSEVATLIQEHRAAGKEIGGLVHVMDAVKTVIPVALKYLHLSMVKIPGAMNYAMRPVKTCDVNGKNCNKNPDRFDAKSLLVLPGQNGKKYCTEKVYTCTPKGGAAALNPKQCLDLRMGKHMSKHKASDYTVTGQCVIDTAKTALFEDAGASNCGGEITFNVENVFNGMISQIARMSLACGDIAACKKHKEMFRDLHIFLMQAKMKMKSSGETSAIKITLCNFERPEPWKVGDGNGSRIKSASGGLRGSSFPATNAASFLEEAAAGAGAGVLETEGVGGKEGKEMGDFKQDAFSPFHVKLDVVDKGRLMLSRVYDEPFVQHFRRSFPHFNILTKIVEDPTVGVPTVFRELINQDWIVSLTKDAAGDWKLSVELPGVREVIESVGGKVEKTIKDLFGETFKFGIALAGKGKSEVMGVSLYTLFKKMGIDKIMGMDESNAKTMNGLWFMKPALTEVWFNGFQPRNPPNQTVVST